MKTFQCDCENQPILFFENSQCPACGRTVGLDDHFNKVEPYDLDEESGQYFKAAQPDVRYQKCDNHAHYNACNGLSPIQMKCCVSPAVSMKPFRI